MSELIMCPHCGQVIDIADPKVARLKPATLAVWHRLRQVAKPNEKLGPAKVAKLVPISKSQAHTHIQRMVAAGLMTAQPKRRGGTYKAYALN